MNVTLPNSLTVVRVFNELQIEALCARVRQQPAAA